MGDQPVIRPLPTHRTTQTQNKHTQTSMPGVGFEPTIPAFERAKIVHALDRAATVIGTFPFYLPPKEVLCSYKVRGFVRLYHFTSIFFWFRSVYLVYGIPLVSQPTLTASWSDSEHQTLGFPSHCSLYRHILQMTPTRQTKDNTCLLSYISRALQKYKINIY
jgi:hypothetical protein